MLFFSGSATALIGTAYTTTLKWNSQWCAYLHSNSLCGNHCNFYIGRNCIKCWILCRFQVAAKLDDIYKTGKLAHAELDERALDALKEFPSDGALSVLGQFLDSNLEHVSNKSAYLCGVMKTYRWVPMLYYFAWQHDQNIGWLPNCPVYLGHNLEKLIWHIVRVADNRWI